MFVEDFLFVKHLDTLVGILKVWLDCKDRWFYIFDLLNTIYIDFAKLSFLPFPPPIQIYLKKKQWRRFSSGVTTNYDAGLKRFLRRKMTWGLISMKDAVIFRSSKIIPSTNANNSTTSVACIVEVEVIYPWIRLKFWLKFLFSDNNSEVSEWNWLILGILIDIYYICKVLHNAE